MTLTRHSLTNVSNFDNPVFIDVLILSQDDPKVFAGAPIGLQVVGKHLRDEETVAAARLIEQIIRV